MHYAEQNARNCALIKTFLIAQGYEVSINWVDYTERAYIGQNHYWLANHQEDTKKGFDVPPSCTAMACKSPSENAAAQLAFNNWFTELKASVVPAGMALQATILKMVEKIRELAPDADLPPDWINPIEAMADKMRTNILPGPKVELRDSETEEVIF